MPLCLILFGNDIAEVLKIARDIVKAVVCPLAVLVDKFRVILQDHQLSAYAVLITFRFFMPLYSLQTDSVVMSPRGIIPVNPHILIENIGVMLDGITAALHECLDRCGKILFVVIGHHSARFVDNGVIILTGSFELFLCTDSNNSCHAFILPSMNVLNTNRVRIAIDFGNVCRAAIGTVLIKHLTSFAHIP